jgi:hypothetical protein
MPERGVICASGGRSGRGLRGGRASRPDCRPRRFLHRRRRLRSGPGQRSGCRASFQTLRSSCHHGQAAVGSASPEAAPTQRGHHLRIIAEPARRACSYNLRAKVETSIGRYERVIGDALRSRADQTEATEIAIAAAALNRMLAFGRPNRGNGEACRAHMGAGGHGAGERQSSSSRGSPRSRAYRHRYQPKRQRLAGAHLAPGSSSPSPARRRGASFAYKT